MLPPTVSHSRESRHWLFRPTPAGGIWLRCILPLKNGYSADKRHFASRDTRDAIFVKNKCRNTRERYLSMRAAFGKAARSNPHWYEIPVSEVVREYVSALADRSGQANTFTNLIAISWAASQICGYEFSWRVAFPNLVIQLTAMFLSKPLRPEIPSRIPMSRAMQHALIDDLIRVSGRPAATAQVAYPRRGEWPPLRA